MPEREERLQLEANLWLASVYPDGRPHLAPVWFVYLEGCIYICTQRRSRKARNLLANPRASMALEDGNQPIVAECSSRRVAEPYPAAVLSAFQEDKD